MTTITIDNQNEIREVLTLTLALPSQKVSTVPIGSKTIDSSKPVKNKSKHELIELTNFLNESTKTLSTNWKVFTNEQKQVFIDFAYRSIDQKNIGVFDVLLFPFRLIVFLFQYDYQAVQAFKDARDVFIDAIFNEVEKDSIHYQQELNKAVDEINANTVGNPINKGNVHEWLNSLLD